MLIASNNYTDTFVQFLISTLTLSLNKDCESMLILYVS